jgi:phage-related protein
MLVETVARALIKAIPSLLNAVYQMVLGLAKGVYQGIITLFKGGAEKVLEAQTNNIAKSVENQKALTKAVKETTKAQKGSVASFDEVNTLTKETAQNQSEIGGGIIGGVSAPTVDVKTEKAESKMSTFSKKILTYFDPITNALKNLFKPIETAFTETNWQGMKEDLKDWLKGFASSNIETMAKGIDLLRVSFEALQKPLKNLWNNALKPIVEDFGSWIIDIVDQTGNAFDYFSERIKEYKDEIAVTIDTISEVIQTIWSVVSPIIKSVLQGIGSKLKTTIDFIFSLIQAVGNAFDFIKNVFSGIKSLIKGDTEEATNYFKKALANIVNIFVGMGNGIISVVNNLWSHIFDAFKGTVNAISGLVGKIGDWVGFDWDLEWNATAPLIPKIPKYIPKLATGTVVPPNREFMAVLGDNKREPEIVSPLSTMKQAFAEVLAQANIGNGSFNGRIEIPLILDGKVIARAIREAEGNMGRQTVFGGFANAY